MIFSRFPRSSRRCLFPVYVLALTAYFAKSVYLYFTTGFLNIGKDIVVATTAICWYVGIVVFNSDYAFTVTNVIIHGVPYFASDLCLCADAARDRPGGFIERCRQIGWFFSRRSGRSLILKSYSGTAAFGTSSNGFLAAIGTGRNLKMYLVPLLALPQLTHYVLDGFIWRRKNNPDLKLF